MGKGRGKERREGVKGVKGVGGVKTNVFLLENEHHRGGMIILCGASSFFFLHFFPFPHAIDME